MKAKHINTSIDEYFGQVTKYLTYEYRGKTYLVSIPVGRSVALGEELATQHRKEQTRIDRALKPEPVKRVKREDTAEYGLEMFLKGRVKNDKRKNAAGSKPDAKGKNQHNGAAKDQAAT